MLIYFGAFVLGRSLDVGGALNMYFARYNLGNESLLAIVTTISYGPALVVALLVPRICKKVDKFLLFYGATIAAIVLSVISWFAGYRSFPAYLTFSILRGIPAGLLAILMFMFTPDCVEYGAYKTGVNASGIAFSLQTFSAKLLAALSAAIGALALSTIGFIEGEGAIQLPGFTDKLFFIYMLFPAIGNLIALPLLGQYKLRDKDVQVMAQYNSGTISREEADTLLGGKY